ncbi:MAG TPA: glutamate dehydrogenase, partial [Candidatus Paceibacterota bacterium]
PAAFENQITGENVKDVKAKIILELANGPITPDADDVLFSKGIHVIPDVLANSGGVTVSTFEWEQNLKGEHWSEKEVFDKLNPILADSAQKIWKLAKDHNTSLRNGAFLLALERIEKTPTP